MIFHAPDPTYARLKSCWKRANSFAADMGQQVELGAPHRLAVQWANCKMMLDAASDFNAKPDKKNKRYWHGRRQAESMFYDIVLLDWFALKVNEFAKTNQLKGNITVAHILYEWRCRMPFDPTKL